MPYLNIRDFGAKGDGQTDDTAALVAAMDAASREEGTVYFPAGHYMIHPVTVPSHITLLGNSSWGYIGRDGRDPGCDGRVVLEALSGDARAFLEMEGVCGTRIIGLTLDGAHKGVRMHGIYSRHTGVEQNNCFEDCRIINFTGSGIRLDWVWVFAIRRCIIMMNKEAGIDCSRGYDGWIIDNQLSANGWAGLFAGDIDFDPAVSEKAGFIDKHVHGMATVTVTANRIEWNKIAGVLLYHSDTMQINGCSIDHNFGPSVMLVDCTAVTVTGNLMRSSGADRLDDMSCHMRLVRCKGISASANSLHGWFGRTEHKFIAPTPFYGIVADTLVGSTVTDNAMFESCSKEAIRDYGGHTATLISDNMYTYPDLTGLKYGDD